MWTKASKNAVPEEIRDTIRSSISGLHFCLTAETFNDLKVKLLAWADNTHSGLAKYFRDEWLCGDNEQMWSRAFAPRIQEHAQIAQIKSITKQKQPAP